MCFSTDIIHSGHIAIIRKAERLGNLIVGVLSDDAIPVADEEDFEG